LKKAAQSNHQTFAIKIIQTGYSHFADLTVNRFRLKFDQKIAQRGCQPLAGLLEKGSADAPIQIRRL
jgi:hypothetical protein